MINIHDKYKYSSAPGALSTLTTSVNLSSLSRATLMSPGKTYACRYTLWICSLSTLENTDENKNTFCSFTTSILPMLSTWCFEHSDDISCSLLVKPSHHDESWEARNTCLWIYALNLLIKHSGEHWWEQKYFLFVHHKHFGKAQHLVLWALWWHQLFPTH